MTTNSTKACSVPGCGLPALARGWCNKHYLRWKLHGDPAYERPSVCTVKGCDSPVEARGWCSAHYLRWKRHGDPKPDAELRQPARIHAETCEVEGCERSYYAQGLCRKHYDRKRQASDPTAPDRRLAFDPFSEHFWDQLDMTGGPDACWPWRLLRNRQGYGQIVRGLGRRYIAHRLAYALTHGPIPDGLEVCHSCDNPPCCNPAHLFLGTHADNMADMKSKGRGRGGNPPGEHNSAAKLTAAQVAEIRQRATESQVELAREFGVTASTVSRILAGKRWTA